MGAERIRKAGAGRKGIRSCYPPDMADPERFSFSPAEIAETRRLLAQTLEARGIRMAEAQLDVAMRRLLLHAQMSGKPPIEVAREMVRTSALPVTPEE
jgi:hypothetical protein